MPVSPLVLIASVTLTAACAFGGWRLWRRPTSGRRPLDHGLALGALALLGLAPWIAVASQVMSGEWSFFAGGIHVVVAAVLALAALWQKRRRAHAETEVAWTFAEKSAALIFAALAIIYFGYFLIAPSAPLAAALPMLIGTVVLLVIVMIIGHTLIALFHYPIDEVDAEPDEREEAIRLRSARNAYYLLVAGMWALPAALLLDVGTVQVIQLWLALMVLSEMVYYGSILAYYRRQAA